MFGAKNGLRVEPRRLPISHRRRRRAQIGCCQSIAHCCASCGAHGWFLTLFCGFVLVSSLPRILVVLDFIITVALFFETNGYSLKNQNWIKNPFVFESSTFDIVVVSFMRCLILFICFAFKYQQERFRKNIYVSFLTVAVTSAYLCVKLLYSETSVALFSLSFVWIECVFFWMVRRRRIRYTPTMASGSYYSLSHPHRDPRGQHRKIMKPLQPSSAKHEHVHGHGKASKYYRIGDDEEDDYSPRTHLQPYQHQQPSQPWPTAAAVPAQVAPNMASSYASNMTPPPALINDTYLDELQHKKKKQKSKKTVLDVGHDRDHGTGSENEAEAEAEEAMALVQNDNEVDDGEEDEKQSAAAVRHSLADVCSFERSMSALSATIPDSEFSAHELPLRTQSSEFFMVDGVAIHYVFERNFNETVANNENLPWLVLLHGFGGGVFSWKRSLPILWKELSDDIRGILAFDRVGFGLTERPILYGEGDADGTHDRDEVGDGGTGVDSKATSKHYQHRDDEKGVNPYSLEFDLKILKTFLDKFEMRNCIFVAHSTGSLVANWFACQHPSYCTALILVAPTSGMPSFVRSILGTKLGKPLILSLVRSEIGQVTLYQAWHNPQRAPSSVIHAYKQVLHLKHWNESLWEMAKVAPYSNTQQYHAALSTVTCPVWLLHGDDDHLVAFRESMALAQCFQFGFGPQKLTNCGHIPHEEIPTQFVEIVKDILVRQLPQFERNKNEEQETENSSTAERAEHQQNVVTRSAQKLKNMMQNINIMQRTKRSNSSAETEPDERKEQTVENTNQTHVNENSALLSD